MPIKWFGKDAALDPQFVADMNAAFAPLPYTYACVRGYASFEEQNALYQKHLAGGPLAAPPGKSAHNFKLAADLCPYGDHGLTWDTKHPAWPAMWAAVKAAPHLHSGHDFPKGETDDDHVESTHWWALRDRLKAEGKWDAGTTT